MSSILEDAVMGKRKVEDIELMQESAKRVKSDEVLLCNESVEAAWQSRREL